MRAILVAVLAGNLFCATASLAAPPQPVLAVPSIAALQALGAGSAATPNISVQGYYAGSNVGGGLFNWQAPSAANRNCAIDKGVVFVAIGVPPATGCWVRQLQGNFYLASWFGAKASNSTADEAINTAALQNLLNAAQAADYGMQLDQCGRYYINDTLSAPLDHNTYLTQPFRLLGCGASIAYDANALSHGSIIAMDHTVDKPLLSYIDWSHHYASGNIEIGFIRWEGCTTTRLIYLQVFTGTSSFHNNDVVNTYRAKFPAQCTGDGVDIDQSAITATIANNTFVGTTSGANTGTRYGTGVSIRPAATGGLFKLIGNTSRGWLNGYVLGGGAGNMIAPLLLQNEVSADTFGIVLNGTQGASLIANYTEGGDDTVIKDCGDRTKILDNWTYGGFHKFIDNSTCDTWGNVYTDNYAETAGADLDGKPIAVTMIDVKADSSGNTYGKVVGGNTLYYAGSNPNVVGIRVTGTDPRISMSPPNNFNPYRPWGGTGSMQVDCAFTGTPVGSVQCGDSAVEFPFLGATTFALAPSATTLTEANVAANVLTIPGSFGRYLVNAAGAASVDSIAVANVVSGAHICFQFANNKLVFRPGPQMLIGADFPTSASGGTMCGYLDIAVMGRASSVTFASDSAVSH